jgi:hypothetical protein
LRELQVLEHAKRRPRADCNFIADAACAFCFRKREIVFKFHMEMKVNIIEKCH